MEETMSEQMTVMVDIDGTIFKQGTNEWLPDAERVMRLMKEQGHYIILITARGERSGWPHIYSKKATLEALKEKNVPYDEIIFDSPSPRIMFNDQTVLSAQVDPDEGLTTDVLDEVTYWLESE
jgi:ribonucleotide monophosphatase NagD (HAD superfamily)